MMSLWSRLEPLLARVGRPARYINKEYACVPAKPDAALRCGFCYPASYELGQSNQALQILYARGNALSAVSAERVFLPDPDLARLMRTHEVPLFTLESCSPVRTLDLLGITLPYELSFPAVLEILDLAGIALRSRDRTDDEPLIVGGGPGAGNPEPLAPFFDAFFVGEAEESLEAICAKLIASAAAPRSERLAALACLPGVYVPRVYDAGKQSRITRQISVSFAADEVLLSPTIVPYAELIHDRLSLEIRRGCTRGCRFCQAGSMYRPVRERDPDAIVRAAVSGIAATGFDEVSLTSLSTADYSCINEVLHRLKRRFAHQGVAVSIPSLRVDSFSVDLARLLAGGGKKSSLTFAPEAGTQRLRDVINKNIDEQQILDTIRYAFSCGWRKLKLYFMIGLPTETDEDVCAIGTLVSRILDTAQAAAQTPHERLQLSVSVSTFVPKAHTPFQWEAQLPLDEVCRRQALVRAALPRKGVRLSWHDAKSSLIEGLIARGGRELAAVFERLWRADPACVYPDGFDFAQWTAALAGEGIDLEACCCRARSTDEALPWDHIETGVSRQWLAAEARAAYRGQTTPDCSTAACSNCGVCA